MWREWECLRVGREWDCEGRRVRSVYGVLIGREEVCGGVCVWSSVRWVFGSVYGVCGAGVQISNAGSPTDSGSFCWQIASKKTAFQMLADHILLSIFVLFFCSFFLNDFPLKTLPGIGPTQFLHPAAIEFGSGGFSRRINKEGKLAAPDL